MKTTLTKKRKKIIITVSVILLIIALAAVFFIANLFHFRNFIFKYIPTPQYSFIDLIGTRPEYFPNKTLAKWEGLTEQKKDLKEWFGIQLPQGWIINKTKAGNGFILDRDNVVFAVYVWSAKPDKENEQQKIFTLDDFVKWRTESYKNLIKSETNAKIAGLDAHLAWRYGVNDIDTLYVFLKGSNDKFYESYLRGKKDLVDIYKYQYIYSLETIKDFNI